MEESENQTLHIEYPIIESKWRWLQGLRYALMAFLGTSHFALYHAYENLLTSIQDPKIPDGFGGFGGFGLFALSLFALVILGTIYLLSARLQIMYRECSRRGVVVETLLLIEGGVFQKLSQAPYPHKRITHSDAFVIAFLADALTWSLLLGTGLFFSLMQMGVL